MRKKIETLAPPVMNLTQAGIRLGLERHQVRDLVKQGHIKKLPMLPGIKANLLASSVDELAQRMYGDSKQAG